MTLYKGPAFQILKGGGAINHHGAAATDEHTDQNWVMGPIMLIASCCSWAGFFILQVSINIYIFMYNTYWLLYEIIIIIIM